MLRRSAASCLIAFGLAGCGGNPPAPEPPKSPLSITITADADLNPDLDGRPSPVSVAILQLKSADAFAKADYFAIYDPDNATLAAEIVRREQFTVQPGGSQSLRMQLEPEVRFLGVAVAFRDIEQANWLALVPLGDAAGRTEPGRATIKLTASAVVAALN